MAQILREPNIADIIQSYHAELWGEERVPCAPDWERRRQAEAAGTYRVWTAYAGKTLAGFIEWQVMPTLNAKETLFAIDCGHYLSTAFRGAGGIGYRMWRSALEALKREGAKVVMTHDNIRHPLMPFMLALGMKPVGTLYHKVID